MTRYGRLCGSGIGPLYKRVGAICIILFVLMLCGCAKTEKSKKIDELKQDKKTTESKIIEKQPVQSEEEDSKETASFNEENKDLNQKARPVIDYLKLSNSTYNSISIVLKDRKNISDIKWSNDKSKVAFGVYDEYSYADEAFMYIWWIGAKEPVEIDAPKDRYCNFFWSPDDRYIIADTGTSVLRTGRIISVKQLKEINKVDYVFDALWSSDSSSIVIGKRREQKTTVATELEGTVDLVSYDFINKKEKIIAKGSANTYCMPVRWDKNGSLIYNINYFDNYREEKYSYIKTGGDFSINSKLTELFQKFSKTGWDELLAGLEPLDVCKLYLNAEDGGDYETMYALYYKDENSLVPALDKFLSDMNKDSAGRQNSRKLLRSLRRDVESIEVYTGEKEAKIVFNYKSTSPEGDIKEFALLKTIEGIWKVRFLPVQ